MKILQQTDSDIVFSVQTGSFINNFEMCKCVTLRKNGDSTLSVNNTMYSEFTENENRTKIHNE